MADIPHALRDARPVRNALRFVRKAWRLDCIAGDEADRVLWFALPRLILALGAMAGIPLAVGFLGGVSLETGVVVLLLALHAVPAMVALRRGMIEGLYAPALALFPLVSIGLAWHSVPLACLALALAMLLIVEAAVLGVGHRGVRCAAIVGSASSLSAGYCLAEQSGADLAPVMAVAAALAGLGVVVSGWIGMARAHASAHRASLDNRLAAQAALIADPMVWISPTGYVLDANACAIAQFGDAVSARGDFLRVIHPGDRAAFMSALAESLRLPNAIPVPLRLSACENWADGQVFDLALRAVHQSDGVSEICLILRKNAGIVLAPALAPAFADAVMLEPVSDVTLRLPLQRDSIDDENVLHLVRERRALADVVRSGGFMTGTKGLRKRA